MTRDNLFGGLAVAHLLPDELPHAYGGYAGVPNQVCLCVPANPKMLREFRRALGRDWKLVLIQNHDKGYWSREYKHAGGWLLVWIEADVEGATCTYKEVGSKTIPVYEMVCN